MNIPVKINGVETERDTSQVEFVEVTKQEKNRCILHFSNGETAKLYISLKQFLKKYGSPDGLIKAHKQFAIHINKVNKILGYCLVQMDSGKAIEMGRAMFKKVKQALTEKLNKGKNPSFSNTISLN
jgi:hypothetical protein